jgi:hypothetical protein
VSTTSITDWVRSPLALGLTATLPIVLFVAEPDVEALRAYMDALAAVIAFYFGASEPAQP